MTYGILSYKKNIPELKVDRKAVQHPEQITLTDERPILTKWVSEKLNDIN